MSGGGFMGYLYGGLVPSAAERLTLGFWCFLRRCQSTQLCMGLPRLKSNALTWFTRTYQNQNNLNTFDILRTWTWIPYAIWFNMFSCYLAKQKLQLLKQLCPGKHCPGHWKICLGTQFITLASLRPFLPAFYGRLHSYILSNSCPGRWFPDTRLPVQQASVLLPTGSFHECPVRVMFRGRLCETARSHARQRERERESTVETVSI